MYDSEYLTINKEDENRLRVFEMVCLRKIVSVGWPENAEHNINSSGNQNGQNKRKLICAEDGINQPSWNDRHKVKKRVSNSLSHILFLCILLLRYFCFVLFCFVFVCFLFFVLFFIHFVFVYIFLFVCVFVFVIYVTICFQFLQCFFALEFILTYFIAAVLFVLCIKHSSMFFNSYVVCCFKFCYYAIHCCDFCSVYKT